MGYSFNFSRDLNILDKDIQEKFWITDIQDKTLKNTSKFDDDKVLDIFMNKLYSEPLYSFKMQGIQYSEYVREKFYSDGNSEFIVIWFDKCEKVDTNLTRITHLNQGWECPKCKEWHFSYYQSQEGHNWKNNKTTCLDCGYVWELSDFEEVFN